MKYFFDNKDFIKISLNVSNSVYFFEVYIWCRVKIQFLLRKIDFLYLFGGVK